MTKFKTLSLALASTLILSACGAQQGQIQGLAPEKQPEITMVRYAHDIAMTMEEGKLSPDEKAKLHQFLDRHNAGYGDVLQLDDPTAADDAQRFEAVRKAVAARGLKLHISPIAHGTAPSDGKARLVMTRHMTTPPACPDWSTPNTGNWTNAEGSNFGCATKTNLAVQVANPRDLLGGQVHSGPEPTATVNAITTYRNRTIGKATLPGTGVASGGSGGSGGSN